MKGKILRVALVLAVLGALAAIPASTQVLQKDARTANDMGGASLPLILLVNRLELSRTQMETLRTTVSGLLAQRDILVQKRASFVEEMIAFTGTAEELDVRLGAFQAEMTSARVVFDGQVSAAVDTLKETLTMKQGEILMDAMPRLFARLDAVSARPAAMGASAPAVDARSAVMGQKGTMMQRAQAGAMMSGGQATATATAPAPVAESRLPARMQRIIKATVGSQTGGPMMQDEQMGTMLQSEETGADAPRIVDRLETMAERIRSRISARIGAAAETTMAVPSAAAVAPACPMMGTMEPATSGVLPPQGEAARSAVDQPAGFGTLTISLSDAEIGAPIDAPRGGQGVVDWLERFVHVLELKLAAQP